MRLCNICKTEKDDTLFGKCRKRPTGLKDACKSCLNAKAAAWRAANPERFRELNNKWHKKNPEKNRARVRQWVAENPDRKKQADAGYREKEKEQVALRQKQWREENAEKIREQKRLRRLANLDEYRTKNRAWQKANPGITAANGARRAARKKRACPPWLTPEQHAEMRLIYEWAALCTAQDNQKWHVDHIVPLGGKTVCGLHVPWNLQIITAKENIAKGAELLVDTSVT